MPKPITVADLFSRPSTPLKGGGTLLARQPSLYCPACGETYSANPGDYWQRSQERVLICGACDQPYQLVDTLGPYHVPVEHADAVRNAIRKILDELE